MKYTVEIRISNKEIETIPTLKKDGLTIEEVHSLIKAIKPLAENEGTSVWVLYMSEWDGDHTIYCSETFYGEGAMRGYYSTPSFVGHISTGWIAKYF